MTIDKIKLAVLMAQREMTWKSLSQLTGVSTNALWKIRHGNQCYVGTAYKLAKALDVTIESLLTKMEEMA